MAQLLTTKLFTDPVYETGSSPCQSWKNSFSLTLAEVWPLMLHYGTATKLGSH